MNLFIYLIMCLIFVFLNGCSLSDYKTPEYEKTADKITEKTARDLRVKKGLILIGTGGQMMHDIKKMMMGFTFNKQVDIETARQLLVDSVEEYLKNINSNEEIRKHLHDYPFTAKNIEIEIYFSKPDRSNVAIGEINIADVNQGKLSYYIDYPEKHTIKEIHEESYEEAFEIARQNNKQLDIIKG